jgi:RNA polymerase sigma-70 factor (ECF subfamily)
MPQEYDWMPEFQRGSPKAFNGIYNIFFNRIYVYVVKIIGNREDAKEIAVETFTKLFNKYADFDNLPELRAFLYVAARNACYNYLKQQQHLLENQRRFMQQANNDEDAASDELEGEVIEEIYKLLEQLPPESKKVLEMIYLEGLKYKEVAERLKISLETVKSQRKYAIDKLRKILSGKQLMVAWMICTTIIYKK